MSNDDSVVARLLTGGSEVRIPAGEDDFLFSETSIPSLGPTLPPVQWQPLLFTGIKRPGRDVDLSPRYSAVDKRERICTSIPPYVLSWRVDRDICPFFAPIFVLDCLSMGVWRGDVDRF